MSGRRANSHHAGECPALGQLFCLLLGSLQQLGCAPQDPGHVQSGEGLKMFAADGVQAWPQAVEVSASHFLGDLEAGGSVGGFAT